MTEEELLPLNHPLYAMHNVIITPHIGGAGSSGTGAGMGRILADNLRLWIAGKRLEKVVIDKTAGERKPKSLRRAVQIDAGAAVIVRG